MNRNGLLFGFVKPRVNHVKVFGASALLALATTLSACSSGTTPTYANVNVTFDDTIVVDQLQFELLQNNAAINDPVLRPETAGAPLTTGISITILLPDSVVGKSLSVRVTGLFQGAVVTSGRVDNVLPLPDRGVDVNIRLGHVLDSFTVTPTSLTLALGGVQQLDAQGTFSDENNGDVSEQVTWTSSNAAVATVSATPGTRGLVTAKAEGTATITATLQDQSIDIPVTVTARKITSLSVAPSSLLLPIGNSSTLRATAAYSDGTSVNVSADPDIQWQSSDPTIVAVDTQGGLTTVALGTAQVTARFGGLTGTSTVNVIFPTLTSLSIEPPGAKTAKGFTRPYTIYGIYTDGTRQDLTRQSVVTIDPPGLATFNTTTGILTGVNTGDITITATATQNGTATASTTATITNAQLVSLSISPAGVTVPKGTSVTYQVTGVYSDGTDSDITSLCTFTSSNPAVATVSGATFTAKAVGTTTVTATPPAGSTPGPVTTTLKVSSATLQSITLAPSTTSIAKGQTATYTVTGVLTDGTTTPLTSQATFTSSNPTAVPMTANVAEGRAVTASPVTITASYTDSTTSVTYNSTAQLTVTNATLISIAITPSPASVIVGTTLNLTATGTYTDGPHDITTVATWSLTAQNPSTGVATIGTASGIVTGTNAGSATINAVLNGITGTLPLTVTAPTLTSIDVLPAGATVIVGNTVQLTARGNYNNGTQQVITNSASWTVDSASADKASVDNGANKGLVTGLAAGTATVRASVGVCPGANCVQGTLGVAVSAATVTSVVIDQASLTLAAGGTGNLTAKAFYNNGTSANVTTTGVWNSSAPAVATVDTGTGQVNAASGLTSSQTTNATIRFSGITSAAVVITVNPAALTSIAVSPSTLALAAGETGSLTATGTYADTSTRDITTTVSWSIPSADSAIATISSAAGSQGVVTSFAAGSTTATATLGSVSGTASVAVSAATTVSIAVTCTSTSIANGNTTQCTAIATRTNNTMVDITNTATWSVTPGSSNPTGTTIVSVDKGLVTGVNLGSASVRATGATSGKTGDSPTITVTAAVLKNVSVTPAAPPAIAINDTQTFVCHATLTDNSQSTCTADNWTSSDESIATCTTAGVCTGLAGGSATITAFYQSLTGTATLTVNP